MTDTATATAKKIRIGDLLVEEGILDQDGLQRVLAEQKRTGKLLGEMLVEQGIASGAELIGVLGKRLGVRGCQLRHGLVDPMLIDLIGEEEGLRLKALPMFKVHNTLTVAMAEPQSLPAVDRLRQLTGCAIRPVLAMENNIVEFIRKYSGPKADMDAFVATLAETDVEIMDGEGPDEGPVTDLDKIVDGSPVVNLVNMVLLKAVKDRASDIHVEPDEKATRIRYRVDGVLRNLMTPPMGMHASIVSRVKVIGKMDIAERRLPQEGRVRITAEGREIDLRVSSMPTLLGEKVVMRILDKENLRISLEDLGFRPETLAAFLRVLRQPYGLALVTGPTGSGKTTTLYSALELVRSPELNIVTVEDPVEYRLDMINQIQVQESIGMTFARALRSILRQDPDVIMVGEIRDQETARVAIQAALTGHVVLATLHTNDAAGAVARLVDMGIEPYLLSSALNGVVAQRLARTVCPNCITTYHPEANVLADAGLAGTSEQSFTRGTGCDQCHKSGFRGRVGIYEVMEIMPELRRMIHKGASTQDLREQWRRGGGLTLREEGVLAALEGKTCLEEVLSVTHGEGETATGAAQRKPSREPETTAVS